MMECLGHVDSWWKTMADYRIFHSKPINNSGGVVGPPKLMPIEPVSEANQAAQYFLTNTTFAFSGRQLSIGTLLSKVAVQRLGITEHIGTSLLPLTPDQVKQQRQRLGIPDDADDKWYELHDELDEKFNADLEQAVSASRQAVLMQSAMASWRGKELEYIAGASQPVNSNADYASQHNYQVDDIGMHLLFYHRQIMHLGEHLKPQAIAAGLSVIELQRFLEASHYVGERPNEHYSEALHAVERMKLKFDLDEAERAKYAGWAGFRRKLNDIFRDESAKRIVGWTLAGIAAIFTLVGAGVMYVINHFLLR